MDGSSKRGAVVVAALMVVLLLPPLYLLSTGPAVWLYSRQHISCDAVNSYAYPADQVAAYLPALNSVRSDYEACFLPSDRTVLDRHLEPFIRRARAKSISRRSQE